MLAALQSRELSRRLLSEVMYLQEAAGLRCLMQEEMKRYNVVNFR